MLPMWPGITHNACAGLRLDPHSPSGRGARLGLGRGYAHTHVYVYTHRHACI